jgi:FYVE/RhoGEF/PH domain-containing protein 5/6
MDIAKVLAKEAATSKLKPTPQRDRKPSNALPKIAPRPPTEPAPPEDEDEKTKMDRKRINIVREIVATEASYVEQLNFVVDLYLGPLNAQKDKGILSQEEIQTLFSNIEMIQDLNSKFLSALRDKVSIAKPDERNAMIGAVFKQFGLFFKMYTQYVNNHSEAVRILHGTLYKREKAKQFLQVNEKISQAKGLDLEALLITPVQRIPRYKLLLEVLIKSTSEDHPDYRDLSESLSTISKVAESINTAMRETQNRQEILNIQKQFTKDIDLISPSRRLVTKSVLTKKCRSADKEFTFFLFNDLLLYAQGGGLTAYFLHRRIEINQAFKVNDLPDSSSGKNMFEILNSQKSFVVYASDSNLKQIWLRSLRDCISEYEANAQARLKLKGEDVRSKSDSYVAPVWASDKSSNQCTICLSDFSLLNRRHHCRKCGILVCGDCSKGRIKIGPDQVRVCDRCNRLAETRSTDFQTTISQTFGNSTGNADADYEIDDDMDDFDYIPPPNQNGRTSNFEVFTSRAVQDYSGNKELKELDLTKGESLLIQHCNYDSEGNVWWYAKSLSTSKTGWVSPSMLEDKTEEKAVNESSGSGLIGVYKALQAFTGNPATEELGFKAGDLIDVVEVHESGYYYGTNRRSDLSGWIDPVYLAQVNLL